MNILKETGNKNDDPVPPTPPSGQVFGPNGFTVAVLIIGVTLLGAGGLVGYYVQPVTSDASAKRPALKTSLPPNQQPVRDVAHAQNGDVRVISRVNNAWKATLLPAQPSSLWAYDVNGQPYTVLPSQLSFDYGQIVSSLPVLPTGDTVNTGGHLIESYSDGSTKDLGQVTGSNGTNATTTAVVTPSVAGVGGSNGLMSATDKELLNALPGFVKPASYNATVPNIQALNAAVITITVPGCTMGDLPLISWTDTTLDGSVAGATVTAPNTVTVRFRAIAAITTGSRSFTVAIIKH